MKFIINLLNLPFKPIDTNKSQIQLLSNIFPFRLVILKLGVYFISTACFLVLSYLSIISNQNLFLFLGLILFFMLPSILVLLIQQILVKEKLIYELDLIIILQELNIVNNTTKSESHALLLLSKSNNLFIKDIGLKSFIDLSIKFPIPNSALKKNIEKNWISPLNSYIVDIFSEIAKNNSNTNMMNAKINDIVMNKLNEDLKSIEIKTTVFNSLFSVLPLFLLIFLFMSYRQPHPLLEIIILLFLAIYFYLYFLDPLGIISLKSYVINDNKDNIISKSSLLLEINSSLFMTRNFIKTLQIILIKYNFINQNCRVMNNLKKKIILGNFTSIEELIRIINMNYGSKFSNLIYLIHLSSIIDVKSTLDSFDLISNSFNSIDTHFHSKKSIINIEKKKSFLILSLNSFCLGIFSIIIPYLAIVSEINIEFIKKSENFNLLANRISLLTIFEFWLILNILYFIYSTIYRLNEIKNTITLLLIVNFVFLFGFSFSYLITKPTLY